jgi:hypothetical protein
MAGFSRKSGSRSAVATFAGSRVPRRCFSFSGPANAVGTVTDEQGEGVLGEQAAGLLVRREVEGVRGGHGRSILLRRLWTALNLSPERPVPITRTKV